MLNRQGMPCFVPCIISIIVWCQTLVTRTTWFVKVQRSTRLINCIAVPNIFTVVQAKQLKDYENAVIAKRLEELDEDEIQALVEDIERDDF
jgi:hypothetical protein